MAPTRRMARLLATTAVVALLATTVAGCEDDDVEPSKYTTLADTSAFTSTRDAVEDFFTSVTSTGRKATSGEELRGGGRVPDVVCDELYPETFRKFTTGGSFLARGTSVDDAMDVLEASWSDRGWKTKRGDEDGLLFVETTSKADVRITATIRVEKGKSGPDVVIVSVKAGTGCLKVPKAALDSAQQEPDEG